MTERFKTTSIVATLLALGTGGLTASASAQVSAPPFSCTIESEKTGTGVHMEGSLTATKSITGTYSFEIRSRRAELALFLQQAGEFEAAPDAPASLGSATLPGDAEDYDVAFHINWNSRTYACGVIDREISAVDQPALP